MTESPGQCPPVPHSIGRSASSGKRVEACTTILVGRDATADGSVMMATSCDGNMMGRVYVQPAREFSGDVGVQMFYDFPAPSTWEEHETQVKQGYTPVGHLPIERSCRCIFTAGHLADSITGGINEYGLSMGIEYMTMRPELANERGIVSSCSNHWTTSLIANGLMRARTAREAIRLMGSMVEEYGFTYYWAPTAGCAIPVADKTEAWIMEIFGPGADWTPERGKPGGVWCAQRVPDGEATCNTNRSRIGAIASDRPDEFMMSPNACSLAEELGLWKPDTPFVWYEAYGTPSGKESSLREWAALNSLAPSLGFKATGDPTKDRYPFSVRPDERVNVRTLTSVMRDHYEGTEFDVTEHPAFRPGGEKSPLARPFGSCDLFDLVGLEAQRCIGTETSGYVYVAQIREELPDPICGCLWLALGPSYTSCFAPVYCGVTEIADSWSQCPDFTSIDRTQVQWNFQLVGALAELKYQEAIKDIRGVFEPAEERFLARQNEFEDAMERVLGEHGPARAAQLVTEYTNQCLANVDNAYDNLVDYLMFKYLYRYPNAAPPRLPSVGEPIVPIVHDLSE